MSLSGSAQKHNAGLDVMKRMATRMIGGVVPSAILEALV
jgi:Cu/Ag efflux pump CusA